MMGLGATALTATQPALAWLLLRHADPQNGPAYRLAVLIGLVLTFVLGASVGGLLSGLQPPETAALPVIGWSLAGSDLRPTHFLGIHAQQAPPLVGLVVAGAKAKIASRLVWAAAAAYVPLLVAALAWGQAGRL